MDSSSPEPVLLVTADDRLADEVRRLAALAGAQLAVVAGAALAGAAYTRARVLLVGTDALAGFGPPRGRRNSALVVVASAEPEVALWRRAVELGADRVVQLPADAGDLTDLLVQASRDQSCHMLAVLGACGGAGASTLAAALAATAARAGSRVVLVDGDRRGGGLDVLLGLQRVAGARWPDVLVDPSRARAQQLPGAGQLAVLSWERQGAPEPEPEPVRTALQLVTLEAQLAVLDLPRPDDPLAGLLLEAADATLLVVPARSRAVLAAGQVAAAVLPRCHGLSVVVRDGPPGAASPLAVADTLVLPLAGRLRTERGIAAATERGELPGTRRRGPLARFCRSYLAAAPLPRRP